MSKTKGPKVERRPLLISPAQHFRERLLKEGLVLDLHRLRTAIPDVLTAEPAFRQELEGLWDCLRNRSLQSSIHGGKRALHLLLRGGSGSGKTKFAELLAAHFVAEEGLSHNVATQVLNFNELGTPQDKDGPRDPVDTVMAHIANPEHAVSILDEVHQNLQGNSIHGQLLTKLQTQGGPRSGDDDLRPHLLIAATSLSEEELRKDSRLSHPDFYTRFWSFTLPDLQQRSLDAAVHAAGYLSARGRFTVGLNALVGLVDNVPGQMRDLYAKFDQIMSNMNEDGIVPRKVLRRLGLESDALLNQDPLVRIVPERGRRPSRVPAKAASVRVR